MSVPKPLIRDAAGDAAVGTIEARGAPIAVRASMPHRHAWLLTVLMFVVPLLTYAPATFHDYGLRDDYSNLREAHEEPGVIMKFCAATARPIYGWLLQASYGATTSVQNLQWMRLLAVLLLGAISLVMFRGLRSLGWTFDASLCFAVLLPWVPSAQVIAGWAIGWPYAVTTLPAIAAFFSVESAFEAGRRASHGRALALWSLALGLLTLSALTYQSSALFYVVPLAGALIAERRRALVPALRWLCVHLIFVISSMAVAYCAMTAVYASGWFVKSGRVAFEHDWVGKLGWFLGEALPNALSLLVLNDNNQRDRGLYLACAALTGLVLLVGWAVEWRRYGRTRGLIWGMGLFGLPVFALGISLVASERYATYRTILGMTAVLLCFLVASLDSLTNRMGATGRRSLAAVVMAAAFLMAQHHVYALIAVPQGNEWQLILQGAKKVRLDAPSRPRVFAIASSPADMSTATIYHDEFGSLSSNSEWVPKEMFKRAMHDLHPDVANLESRYVFAEGYKLPAGESYDVVIDLHQLRRFYTDD